MNKKEVAEAIKVYESIALCQTHLKNIHAARVDGNILKISFTGRGSGFGSGTSLVERQANFPMGSPNELAVLILDYFERAERASIQSYLRRLAQLGCEKPEGVE